jgi:hypothetical protein
MHQRPLPLGRFAAYFKLREIVESRVERRSACGDSSQRARWNSNFRPLRRFYHW